jgi:hypothetical protein
MDTMSHVLHELPAGDHETTLVAEHDGEDVPAYAAATPASCGFPAGRSDPCAATNVKSVNGLEGLGVAAELLSWIGPMIGLPLLVLGMILRSTDRGLVPTQVVVVDQAYKPRARWFAAEGIYERRLRVSERARLAGKDVSVAYVSPARPTLMSLERRRPVTSVCLSLGATLTIVGICGLVLSTAQSLIN